MSKILPDPRNQYLLMLLGKALVDIRHACRHGDPALAGDLADVFHNLPDAMASGWFDLDRFCEEVDWFLERHPESPMIYGRIRADFMETQ